MFSWTNYFLRTIFLPSPFKLLTTFREFWLLPFLSGPKTNVAYYSSQESLLCLEKNGGQDLRQEMLMRDEEKFHWPLLKIEKGKSERNKSDV